MNVLRAACASIFLLQTGCSPVEPTSEIGDPRPGESYFEGDIVLDPEDVQALEAGEVGGARAALLAERSDSRLWPRGVVPYVIGSSVTTPARVRSAMREWEEKTAVRFVARTSQAAYVTFIEERDNTVCRAQVGYNGGRRYVYLRDTRIRTACNLGVIVHEIGHTLGLWHEHTRTDRDDYVRIIWANVGLESAFAKKTTGVRLLGTYDIASTMHYRSFTLSSPSDRPSIVRRDGSLILHNWEDLSRRDIAMMERLYPSPDPVVEPPPDAGVPEEVIPPDAGAPPLELVGLGPSTKVGIALPDEETLEHDVPADRVLDGGCAAGGSGAPPLAALVLIALVALARLIGIRSGG